MRIAHIVTLVDEDNSYGGPITVALNHCRELRRRGHDAFVMGGWTGRNRPPREVEGVPLRLFRVRRIVPGMRFAGLYSQALISWIRQHAAHVDLAHIHLSRDLVPLFSARAFHRNQVPYVVQTHGMVLPDKRIRALLLDRILTRNLLSNAASRLVLTDPEATALQSLCRGRLGLTYLLNGVPEPESYGSASLEDDVLDVLFMARLHPRKRVMAFAEAAEIVCKSMPDARFSVVGPDEGDLDTLRNFIAARPSLHGRLCYEGPLAHHAAMRRLARAHVYVLPSVDEPFPMSLLEAASRGVPSICTPSCAAGRDLAVKGAVSVAGPEAVSIAEAVIRIISDGDLFHSLRTTGLRIVGEEYSIGAVVDRLEDVYSGAYEENESGAIKEWS